jgi:hypothetical protein
MLNDPVSRALAMAPMEDEEIGEEEKSRRGTLQRVVSAPRGHSLCGCRRRDGLVHGRDSQLQGTGSKRIVFSDDAKTDIRAIPQYIAMNILGAIHRLAETGAGRVKTLQDSAR